MPEFAPPLYTSEHRVPSLRDARWLGRRARNVGRHPLLLALLAGCGFLLALLTVILVPRGAQRVARARSAPIPARRDTVRAVEQLRQASDRLRGAQAALDEARRDTIERVAVVVDTLTPAQRARRDSLSAAAAALDDALSRAVSAPLAPSFRALAERPELQRDARVVPLLDSLGTVERARAELEALGVVDPQFMALTARVAEIGAELEDIARERLDALRREIGRLSPRPVVAQPAVADTVPFRIAFDSARRQLQRAQVALGGARAHNANISQLEEERRRAASGTSPPPVILAAAGVLGLVIGFLLALGREMQRPAIADAREAEAATGAPVLLQVVDLPAVTARTRRRADRAVPPLIELTSDRYDRLYFQLGDVVSRMPSMAVLGDAAPVVAAVASNLAAAAARTARATLLLDMDFDTRSVSSVLRVPASPGMAEVLAHRVQWASALVPALVGRDRTVDVLPAGTVRGGTSLASAAGAVREEVERFARRYDTLIVSSPTSRRGAVSAVGGAVGEAIVVVRVGRTPIRTVQRLLAEARTAGTVVRGVVLWDRDDPQLLAPPEPGPRSPSETDRNVA